MIKWSTQNGFPKLTDRFHQVKEDVLGLLGVEGTARGTVGPVGHGVTIFTSMSRPCHRCHVSEPSKNLQKEPSKKLPMDTA
jgi:hypothetical protein